MISNELIKTAVIELLRRAVIKLKCREKADEALRKMRVDRVHLAIVVNDKDEPIGLVTLEDLIEEIVGETED